jgi:hypothetical protein
LCIFFQPLVTSSPFFFLNILVSILFSDTLNPCTSLDVRNHISHPYKTAPKIYYSFVYFNLKIFRQQPRRQKILKCMVTSVSTI